MPSAQQLFNDLFQRRARGMEPGLAVIQALLEELGHPHRQLLCIHIAGTNGKGSVAAMLSACLTRAGYRAGLYTSPHLVNYTERFRINDKDIGEDELADCVRQALEAEARLGGRLERPATFFELSTAAAYRLFHEREAQICVIETGMGGTWDATNVIVPLISVITPVSLDHVDYLGHTIEAVATEKCGIIKRGRPVVCAPQEPEVLSLIRTVCREREAPLIMAEETVAVRVLSESLDGQRIKIESLSEHYRPVQLPLAGRVQCVNASVAAAVCETLDQHGGIALPADALVEGLESARWPGRFDHVCSDPDIVIDGAHNPAGFEALADWLQRAAKDRDIRCITGFLKDKNISECLRRLASKVRRGWAVTVDSRRAETADHIAAAATAYRMDLTACTWGEAAAEGVEWARRSGGLLLICGSLYLAGAARSQFGKT